MAERTAPAEATRPYTMTARAKKAAATRERVLRAAEACFGEDDYDAVTLKAIAARAGVGLQTVVRTGGSKEALFAEVAERFLARMMTPFDAAAAADWRVALRQLHAFYEEYGDRTQRIMAHERRIPEVGAYVTRSRALQRAFIEANYGDALAGLCAAEREQRLAVAMALTGGKFWFSLRRDHGLSAEDSRAAVERQLAALLDLPR